MSRKVVACTITSIEEIPGANNVVICRSNDLVSVVERGFLQRGERVIYFPYGTRSARNNEPFEYAGFPGMGGTVHKKRILGIESPGIFLRMKDFLLGDHQDGEFVARHIGVIDPSDGDRTKPRLIPYTGPEIEFERRKVFLSHISIPDANNDPFVAAVPKPKGLPIVMVAKDRDFWLSTPRLIRQNLAIDCTFEPDNPTLNSVYQWLALKIRQRLEGSNYFSRKVYAFYGFMEEGIATHIISLLHRSHAGSNSEPWYSLESSSDRRDIMDHTDLNMIDIRRDRDRDSLIKRIIAAGGGVGVNNTSALSRVVFDVVTET